MIERILQEMLRGGIVIALSVVISHFDVLNQVGFVQEEIATIGRENKKSDVLILDYSQLILSISEGSSEEDLPPPEQVGEILRKSLESLSRQGYIIIDSSVVVAAPDNAYVYDATAK